MRNNDKTRRFVTKLTNAVAILNLMNRRLGNKSKLTVMHSPFTGNVFIKFKGEVKFKIRRRIFRDVFYIKLK